MRSFFESKTSLLNMVHLIFQLIFWWSGSNTYWFFSPSYHQRNKIMEWNFYFQFSKYLCYVSSPFHFFCNIAVGFCLHTFQRLGQKTLRQKMRFGILCKMSNQVSSLTFGDLLSNVSPVKVSRGALNRTSWHTWSTRLAVMLRKWLSSD